ncbi:MAG: YihY family inner membrane protein [Proteobacteria bacterium]|uniref:YihY family inner membrane protein n=1 Tax=Rudaea sp. TaxID=2136325 RepID=UPI003784F713|nr:YihY family inner membrane protein [Pseudomonadota bacterium]
MNFDRNRYLSFGRFMLKRFLDDRCPQAAGALAYTTLFALVPLITAVLGILSAFPAFAEWQDRITQYLFDNFVPSAGDTIHAYFTEFTANAGKATAIGILVLLFSVISLMMSIEDAFNRIWRVPTGRPLTSRLLMYWAVLTAGPILMVGALAISSYVFALPMLAQAGESFQVKARLLGLLPSLIQWFALTAIYGLVPNCRVRIRHAAIGALIAAVAFELVKRGFVLYVGKSYNQVYGALAILPMFIVWIYLSWIIVLVGASIAATLAAFDYRPDAPKLAAGDELRGLVRVLAHFAQAQRLGEGLNVDALRQREPFLSDASTQRYLGDLTKAGLIRRSEAGDFVLARDLATVSLYELYAASGYRIPLHEPLPVAGDVALDALATGKLGAAADELRATLDTPLAEIFPAGTRSNVRRTTT